VKDLATVKDRGTMPVKGRHEPLRVYEVLAIGAVVEQEKGKS